MRNGARRFRATRSSACASRARSQATRSASPGWITRATSAPTMRPWQHLDARRPARQRQKEKIVQMTRGGMAAILLACSIAWGVALAQGKAEDGLAVGRQMLAEDNPGELWVQRGQKLFHERSGPKQASLEQCDLGLGAGKLEGAFAHLPRFFADTDKVQDLESRLLTCMVELQG